MVASLVSMYIGFAIGLALSTKDEKQQFRQRNALSFGLLGLLFGFLIGISNSPTVSAVLTGAIAFTGVLLTALWDRRSVAAPELPKSDLTVTKVQENSEERTKETITERTTKLHRRAQSPNVSLESGWLIPFTGMAFVGVVLGISVRTSRLLDFYDNSIPARLERLGFDEPQIATIMERLSSEISLPIVLTAEDETGGWAAAATATADRAMFKQSSPPSDTNWQLFWEEMKGLEDTEEGAKQILNAIKERESVPIVVRRLIDELLKENEPIEVVLKLKEATKEK